MYSGLFLRRMEKYVFVERIIFSIDTFFCQGEKYVTRIERV